MSVYRRKGGRTFAYDFWLHGVRHRGTTGQLRREDAERWEKREQLRLAQLAGGVAPFRLEETPRFSDWAETYYAHAAQTLKAPDRVEHLLRVVLRFWGARPSQRQAVEGAPYHDLRLGHPLVDPQWIVRFEAWLTTLPRWRHQRRAGVVVVPGAVGRSGQSRNQYRSTLSQMFHLALTPQYRAITGITTNPFVGVARDRPQRRTVALSGEQLRALIAHAAPHVRLALSIGILAPKLRLGNILALQWRTHLDAGLQWITVHDHKTDQHVARPLVVPISDQLRTILLDAKARHPRATHVVTYRGRPIRKGLAGGVRGAAERAGLDYGRFVAGGLTFHTLRHTAATLLAELQADPTTRMNVMGHERLETTRHYTHLRPTAERAPLEELSAALPIADLVVTVAGRRLSANFGGQRAKG